MKTSAELQQQSLIRKLVYFGLIIVLFTVMTFSGRFASAITQRPSAWTVSSQARRLQLNESDQGEADLAGSTIRLALSGTRGFAISVIWIATIEKQKKHEWDAVELLVGSITKLQPHFLTPWLFQSWNLAYNVSVESDRVRDKYFYISRGIELLADGERINRSRGIDANGQEYVVGHPDMRYWVGFYYANKFGTSDDQHTLRSLLQLSSINPSKRDPNQLLADKRTVDPVAFREFVKQNPLLCRRLRDFLRCRQPQDVVDFLAESTKIPSRYEEIDGQWQLKRRPQAQFPVMPDSPLTAETLSPYQEFAGNFDSYHCSWAWHTYSMEPLPPVEYGKPAAGVPPFNPLRYRMPRSPASIIFRQQPARDLSYIAERLKKEGWFDDSGWAVDEGRQTDQWFPDVKPDDKVVVGNDPRYSSLAAWRIAYQNWEAVGREHGYLLSESEKRNLAKEAELYRATFGNDGSVLGGLIREQVTEEMWRSFDAHSQLRNLEINENMTNFRHFLYRSQAESDDRTMRMRREMFAAERLNKAGRPELAIRRYHDAFESLTGDSAAGKQGLLETYPDFRRDSTIQDELIEDHLNYLSLLETQRGPTLRSVFAAENAAVLGALNGPVGVVSSLIYQYAARPRELPSLVSGPLDGVDSRGQAWINESNMYGAKLRRGLVKAPTTPPVVPGPFPGSGSPGGNPPGQ